MTCVDRGEKGKEESLGSVTSRLNSSFPSFRLQHIYAYQYTLFTTPPLTRKRKAAEAANKPTTSAATEPPVAVGSRNATSRSSSSSSRKTRKVEPVKEETESAPSSAGKNSDFGEEKDSDKKKGYDLVTPATTSMDSDDDFMSDASSNADFLDDQGSDIESVDGTLLSYEPDLTPVPLTDVSALARFW